MAEGRKKTRKGGCNTPKYKVIRGNFYPLIVHFEQVLPQLAVKAFGKELITNSDMLAASNTSQPSFERSTGLLNIILKRIECDQNWYDVLVEILGEFHELHDIKSEVETALMKEEESTCASARIGANTLKPSQLAGSRHSRRHSDSDVLLSPSKAQFPKLSELDSGHVTDDKLFEDNEEAEYDSSGFEDHNLSGAQLVAPPTHLSNQSNKSLNVVKPETVVNSVPISSHNGSSLISEAIPYDDPSSEDAIDSEECTNIPIQMVSNDTSTAIAVSHQLESFSETNVQLTRDIKYLRSENQQQVSELSDQNERIEQLKKELAESVQKVKQQGLILNEKDCIINEKNKDINTLKKKEAEMEKIIKDLRAKCEEAEKNEAENEVKIKGIHESYKAEIEELRKNLEDLETKEREAQINLEKAKSQLLQAELEKMKEISKLKEEFYKQEKIKFELELRIKNLQNDKDKEGAFKDKKLAEKAKELAEEKEKNALEMAKRAQEEKRRELEEERKKSKQLQEEKDQALEERRKSIEHRRRSEEQVEKLRMELENLKASVSN